MESFCRYSKIVYKYYRTFRMITAFFSRKFIFSVKEGFFLLCWLFDLSLYLLWFNLTLLAVVSCISDTSNLIFDSGVVGIIVFSIDLIFLCYLSFFTYQLNSSELLSRGIFDTLSRVRRYPNGFLSFLLVYSSEFGVIDFLNGIGMFYEF